MRKFSLENKKRFDDAYTALEFPLAEHSFSWIYLWDSCYKDIEWEIINKNLCLFITFEGNRYVWGPVLPGKKLADTLRKCFSLCENYNVNHKIRKRPAVMYIPEELKKAYSSLEGFKIVKQDQDYVYNTASIIELKGEPYKDKRNKRNYFMKNYEFSVEGYSAAKHKRGCMKLLDKWKKSKIVKEDEVEKLEWDVDANIKMIELEKTLGTTGMVVLVDKKIEGFIFGETVNKEMCSLFFGKTNLGIKGLSQFIYGEFLKKFFPKCKLVNDGEDWGVEYLKHTKMSYKPDMIKQSYKLVGI